jgi:thioredoxin-like negative regulator of GroEL
MTGDDAQELAALEEAIAKDPDNLELRCEALDAYVASPDLDGDPRRASHVLWLVQHHPDDKLAQTPYAWFSQDAPRDTVLAVERAWQKHVDAQPGNSEILRGLACFVAQHGDPQRAVELLHGFMRDHFANAALWLDLGRIRQEPRQRLTALQQARAHGSNNPNVLRWVATAAVDADELNVAEATALELLARAQKARDRYGDAVDWRPDAGEPLIDRAMDALANRRAARELVWAHSQHADDKHWGHTVLGVLATRAENMAEAIQHMHQSAVVVGSPRLASYGPSMRLAKCLCVRGEWAAVSEYLKACGAFWDDARLAGYRGDVDASKMPDWNEEEES